MAPETRVCLVPMQHICILRQGPVFLRKFIKGFILIEHFFGLACKIKCGPSIFIDFMLQRAFLKLSICLLGTRMSLSGILNQREKASGSNDSFSLGCLHNNPPPDTNAFENDRFFTFFVTVKQNTVTQVRHMR